MPSSGFDLTLGTYFEKSAPDINILTILLMIGEILIMKIFIISLNKIILQIGQK
tara:strand:- start:357 stop:518 length:162 start_codon:yes stop_codon:yes gene_type:complete